MSASGPGLRRTLSVGGAVVIGLGSMIGAGIFAALAPAAHAAGSGQLLGLSVAAVVAYCNAMSSARLADLYPASGGTYVYGRERLGEFWGYLAGWSFVVGKTASCGVSRTTLAMARRPGALAAVHPRFQVPHWAELAVGAVGAVLAATVDVRARSGSPPSVCWRTTPWPMRRPGRWIRHRHRRRRRLGWWRESGWPGAWCWRSRCRRFRWSWGRVCWWRGRLCTACGGGRGRGGAAVGRTLGGRRFAAVAGQALLAPARPALVTAVGQALVTATPRALWLPPVRGLSPCLRARDAKPGPLSGACGSWRLLGSATARSRSWVHHAGRR